MSALSCGDLFSASFLPSCPCGVGSCFVMVSAWCIASISRSSFWTCSSRSSARASSFSHINDEPETVAIAGARRGSAAACAPTCTFTGAMADAKPRSAWKLSKTLPASTRLTKLLLGDPLVVVCDNGLANDAGPGRARFGVLKPPSMPLSCSRCAESFVYVFIPVVLGWTAGLASDDVLGSTAAVLRFDCGADWLTWPTLCSSAASVSSVILPTCPFIWSNSHCVLSCEALRL
mmetsp:Transcript_76519/g.127542  ORF Transcript_76519/g.127542 Transcript_76519/m.127542 type:complete len:233 (+) Transcript_76519:1705-2403(+)